MVVLLAFALGAAAWWSRRVRTSVLVAVLAGGVLVAAVGIARGIDGYPWSNGVVLATGAAGGTALGRVVPPRARPMLTLLVVLAALDAAQLLVAGSAQAPPVAWESWLHVVVRGAEGANLLKIGIADLVLVAAMTEHWRRRGAGFWPATLCGPLGLAIAAVFAWIVRPEGGLVLVPFLLGGWLLTEAWWRGHHRGPMRSRK